MNDWKTIASVSFDNPSVKAIYADRYEQELDRVCMNELLLRFRHEVGFGKQYDVVFDKRVVEFDPLMRGKRYEYTLKFREQRNEY